VVSVSYLLNSSHLNFVQIIRGYHYSRLNIYKMLKYYILYRLLG